MIARENTCLIACDGGGTACRMALVLPGNATRRRYDLTLGPANAATDRAGAIATIHQGVRALSQQAGLATDQLTLARLHAALAGIRTEADRQQVAGALKQQLGLAHVSVSDDQASTVVGALGADDGTVVGVGTGSYLARQHAGQMRFVGGWGLILGDQASGAWLGRELLTAVLRVVDGLEQPSPICAVVLARFANPQAMSTHAASADPKVFAALAPMVVEHAQGGDRLARDLMRRGGDYIEQGLAALGHGRGETIVFAGGLAASYQPWLADDILAGLCAPKGSALDGALVLAAQPEVRI